MKAKVEIYYIKNEEGCEVRVKVGDDTVSSTLIIPLHWNIDERCYAVKFTEENTKRIIKILVESL